MLAGLRGKLLDLPSCLTIWRNGGSTAKLRPNSFLAAENTETARTREYDRIYTIYRSTLPSHRITSAPTVAPGTYQFHPYHGWCSVKSRQQQRLGASVASCVAHYPEIKYQVGCHGTRRGDTSCVTAKGIRDMEGTKRHHSPGWHYHPPSAPPPDRWRPVVSPDALEPINRPAATFDRDLQPVVVPCRRVDDTFLDATVARATRTTRSGTTSVLALCYRRVASQTDNWQWWQRRHRGLFGIAVTTTRPGIQLGYLGPSWVSQTVKGPMGARVRDLKSELSGPARDGPLGIIPMKFGVALPYVP